MPVLQLSDAEEPSQEKIGKIIGKEAGRIPGCRQKASMLRGREGLYAGNGMRAKRKGGEERFEIFCPQYVVGGAGQPCMGGAFCSSPFSCSGKGQSCGQICTQKLPVVLRLPGKKFCGGQELRQITGIGAKDEVCHHPEALQDGDGTGGKALRTGKSVPDREFQHQVRTGFQQCPCPQLLGIDGRNSALHKVTAHDDDDGVGPGGLPCPFQNVSMPFVKRIALHDNAGNACGIHDSPFVYWVHVYQ